MSLKKKEILNLTWTKIWKMLMLIDRIKNNEKTIIRKMKKNEDYSWNLKRLEKSFDTLQKIWEFFVKNTDKTTMSDIKELFWFFDEFVESWITYLNKWKVVFKWVSLSYDENISQNEQTIEKIYEDIKKKVEEYWLELWD